VPYRERFFSRLSKYKKIDAPGKSMNNMPSLDGSYPGDRWQAKRAFQQAYKFTLALENYVYPGYQTEKLYDSMRAHTIPIYIGDPLVDHVFDTESFVCASAPYNYWIKRIENFAQYRFVDLLPAYYNQLHHKISRKLKSLLKDYKMKIFMDKLEEELVDKIVYLDQNDDAYLKMLSKPWLKGNTVPASTFSGSCWEAIFYKVHLTNRN